MSVIELDIKDNLLHFHFSLSRRFNFIKGSSAVGKSTFYDLLNRKLTENDDEVTLSCNINVKLLNFSNVSDFNESVRDLLFIVDDLDILDNSDFLKHYESMVERNLWFVIMSREEVDDTLKTTLTFSTNSIFKLDDNDNYYTLSPLYDLNQSYNMEYDCVIIEDEKAGYTFFNKLYRKMCKVISSKGKNNIIKETIKAEQQGYKNILVIYDSASFGSCFEEFYKYASYSDINISIISTYECFEELLANTSLLRYLEDIDFGLSNIEIEASKFSSWERYFEFLVQKATKEKPYKYVHRSDLRSCYIDSCDNCNEYIRNKCDYIRKDDEKIRGLLAGGKYEFLLSSYIE